MSSRAKPTALFGFWLEGFATLRLGLPIIFGQMLQNSLGIIDTIMVGRVSVEAVAAGSFANALFIVPMVFGFGTLGAVSVFVARAAARGDSAETVQVLRRGLILSLGLALCMIVCMLGVCRYLAIFDEPLPVVNTARTFLLLLTCSLIPMYLFQTLKQYCEALHAAWIPMLILMTGVAVNTGLNWIFIYGHLGFPALGLQGAGCSTLITRTCMLGVLVFFVGKMFFKTEELRKTLVQVPFDFHGFWNLLGIGLPAGFQVILEVGAFAMAAIMMGWISEVALAAHQVAVSVASISFMFPLGLSTAVAIRVSHAVGSGLPRQARQAAQGSLFMTLVFMTISTLIIVLIAPSFAGIFVQDARVVALASHILIVAGLLQIFDGIQIVSAGALRGLHDVKIPTLLNFCGYWVVGLPTSYFLAFHCHWGAIGIWWGLFTGIGVLSCLHFCRLEQTLRKSFIPVHPVRNEAVEPMPQP